MVFGRFNQNLWLYLVRKLKAFFEKFIRRAEISKWRRKCYMSRFWSHFKIEKMTKVPESFIKSCAAICGQG